MNTSFNRQEKDKNHTKEYRRRETIIMPGIEHGVIPTQVLPENMADVMTKYYEKIFPPDSRKKRLLHLGGIALFLIIVFGLAVLSAMVFAYLPKIWLWLDWNSGCVQSGVF